MKQRALIILLFCCCSSHSLLSQSASRGTLEICICELRSNMGMVDIGINTLPEGWPRKPQIEVHFKKEDIVNDAITVSVPDLPYGILAISVLDDENSNMEMDMTFGIPKEGYGFSNDVPIRLSPPKYEDCSFQFSKSGQQVSIHMRYRGKGK